MRSAFHAKILLFEWGSHGWKSCIVVYLQKYMQHVRYM